METYFVEIVYDKKEAKRYFFLRCLVQAENKEQSAEKALTHYKEYLEGEFKVQCNWIVNVPKREVFEKHWKQVTGSYFPKPVTNGSDFEVIGYKKTFLDETEEDVLQTWDACNAEWASDPVYYNPQKQAYVVQIHNHMNMPHDLIEFKGNTKETYDVAMKWVEENTFHGDHFRELKLK